MGGCGRVRVYLLVKVDIGVDPDSWEPWGAATADVTARSLIMITMKVSASLMKKEWEMS